jgi:protein-tyrosine phosphatase
MELRVEPDIPGLFRQNRVLSFCNQGKYMLVDFHPAVLPLHLDELIFRLMLAGTQVIIAHPERNREFVKQPDLLFPLLLRGALLQINAGSLTGDFGSQVQKTAEQFLRLGWASFMASDGHSTNHRQPVLSPGLKAASRIIGEENACRLVLDNPQKVVTGERLEVGEITPIEGRKVRFVRNKKMKWWR